MKALLRIQPVLIGQAVGAVIALAVAYGAPIDDGQKAAIIGVVVVLATVFIHQSVASPSTVATAVSEAATKTAAQLTTSTVGAAGNVTAAGTNVVSGVVNEVLDGVGGVVGRLTGGKDE